MPLPEGGKEPELSDGEGLLLGMLELFDEGVSLLALPDSDEGEKLPELLNGEVEDAPLLALA